MNYYTSNLDVENWIYSIYIKNILISFINLTNDIYKLDMTKKYVSGKIFILTCLVANHHQA